MSAMREGIQVILTTHSLELIDGLLHEATGEDLKKLSLFRTLLKEGQLLTSRLDGEEVAFARSQIQDDLR